MMALAWLAGLAGRRSPPSASCAGMRTRGRGTAVVVRLLAVFAAALAIGAAAAAPTLAHPPCWPDCELGPPEPPYYETPTGQWDRPLGDGNGSLAFTGWALDSDKGTEPISVRLDVYRYDQSVPGWRVVFDGSRVVLASQPRAGISQYLAGSNHGYSTAIPLVKSTQTASLLAKVCMTAINFGAGTDAPLYPNYRAFQTSGNCWLNIWLE